MTKPIRRYVAASLQTRRRGLGRTIADLKPIRRGWFGCFQHARPPTFTTPAGLFALYPARLAARHRR